MIERAPILNFFTHLAMLTGLALAALPIYIVFVASSRSSPAGSASVSRWAGR